MCPSIVEIVKFEKRFRLDCRYIPVYTSDGESNLLTSIDITNFRCVKLFLFFLSFFQIMLFFFLGYSFPIRNVILHLFGMNLYFN